jgi:hypothetical protein
VEDRVRRLLVAVRGMLDQRSLGLLETLGLSAPALDHGTPGWIEILVTCDATDARSIGCRRVDLLLFTPWIRRHLTLRVDCSSTSRLPLCRRRKRASTDAHRRAAQFSFSFTLLLFTFLWHIRIAPPLW